MKVVGYIRLSRDEDRESYSSIVSQRKIIEEYAGRKAWEVDNYYIDDNCSGYTFKRKAFQSMLERVEAGDIRTILVKDLSRLGRNNGRVLVLLDRFRELNVSLILITEGSGGLDMLTEEQDTLGIKTWYNEMYIRDISRKIRSSMGIKQKNGELIMGNYYGYKKIKNQEAFNLIIDSDIKPIVQLIFKLYIEGLGYYRICTILEEKGYPTPSEVLRQNHFERGKEFKNKVTTHWQTYMVQRILANEIYIGTLITRKSQTKWIKGKQRQVSRGEQYVFENHHEGIISLEDFNRVKEINLNRKGRVNRPVTNKRNYYFSRFLVCGECGSRVTGVNLKKLPAIEKGYNCSIHQKYGRKRCCNLPVREGYLIFCFNRLISEILEEYDGEISRIKGKTTNLDIVDKELKRNLKNAKLELEGITRQRDRELSGEICLEDRCIVEKAYGQLQNIKNKQIEELMKKSEAIHPSVENYRPGMNEKCSLDFFLEGIYSEIRLGKILDRIVIYGDRAIEFYLNINIDRLTC